MADGRHIENRMGQTGLHDKLPPPSVVRGLRLAVKHVARFAVAQGHSGDPRMGSLKIPCRTSHWSSTVAQNAFRATHEQTNEQRTEGKRRGKARLALRAVGA